jgi:hypothetical protein
MCQNNEITEEVLIQYGFENNNGLYSRNGLNIARIGGAWRNLVLYNNEYEILNTITTIDELETLLNA